MARLRRIPLLVVTLFLVTSAVTAAVPVTADQQNAQISAVSISPEEPTAGERITLEPEISNLESSSGTIDITDVYVRTSGGTKTHERVSDVGSVGPGGSVSVPLSVRFDWAGEQLLTVHVVVEDESGDRQTYEYPVAIDVEEPVVEGDLSVRSTNQSDTTDVEITNYGNVDLSNVELTALVDGEIVARNPTFDVEPESSQSARFDTERVANEDVTFTATYTAAGSEYETTTSWSDDRPVKGEIRLTGVETIQTGSELTIQGDASNIGSTDAESVLVSVPESSDVSPTAPLGEYFVGMIDGSEFATFELTAEVGSETSSVPVEITYIVDDERITTTQQVDVDVADPSVSGTSEQAADGELEGESGGQSSGILGRIGGGLLLGVLIGGLGAGSLYYVWDRK